MLSLFNFLEQWMNDCNYRGCAFLNTMAETPDTDSPMRKEIQNHKDSHRQFIRRRVDAVFPLESDEVNQQKTNVIFLLFEAGLIESQNFCSTWPIVAARKQVEA
ncbi:MAG: TetR family transcriptional regulator C-terminal domain-containing protein, partial [Verrucomicrobiia bacterium]